MKHIYIKTVRTHDGRSLKPVCISYPSRGMYPFVDSPECTEEGLPVRVPVVIEHNPDEAMELTMREMLALADTMAKAFCMVGIIVLIVLNVVGYFGG